MGRGADYKNGRQRDLKHKRNSMQVRFPFVALEEVPWQGPETCQQPAKQCGPQTCNGKEINSANNLILLGSESFPSQASR